MARTHYIGIDPSITSTGISYLMLQSGKVSKEYTGTVGSKKNDKIYPFRGERFRLISTFVEDLAVHIKKGDHIVVTFERYAMAGKGQIATLAELQGWLKAKVETVLGANGGLVSWEIRELPPLSLKKFTTGSGKSKKPEMALHCETKFKRKFQTDDEVDAYCLNRASMFVDDPGTLEHEKRDLVRAFGRFL